MKLRSPRTRYLGRCCGLRVYAVSGLRVREGSDIDFTQGGNEAVYPSYVPRGEIWVEAGLGPRDASATILHEIVERDLMLRRGLDYEHAHDIASARELAFRRTLRGLARASLPRVASAFRLFRADLGRAERAGATPDDLRRISRSLARGLRPDS